jgi:hypothetical protein
MQFSEELTKTIKQSLSNNIIDTVNSVLIDGEYPDFMVFIPIPDDEQVFAYAIIPDMTAEYTYQFSKLEVLVDRILTEYSKDDVVCVQIPNKNVKSVKFYHGKVVASLQDALAYKDVVADEHTIVALGTMESFKFNNGDIVYQQKL